MTDTTNPRWHLTKVYSDRGFARLPEIPSEYNGNVSVYESSSAEGPHVWLRAAEAMPGKASEDVALHLTADNAARLGEQLLLLTRDHYQGDPLRFALTLIGTTCENFTLGDCTNARLRRSPYAKFTADRWCDRCIARTALEGGEFPERGTSGVEEVDGG